MPKKEISLNYLLAAGSAKEKKDKTALSFNDLSNDEKLVYFALAPKAIAAKVEVFTKGKTQEFQNKFIGKLRGKFIQDINTQQIHFLTKSEARTAAQKFRESCIKEASERGLIKKDTKGKWMAVKEIDWAKLEETKNA